VVECVLDKDKVGSSNLPRFIIIFMLINTTFQYKTTIENLKRTNNSRFQYILSNKDHSKYQQLDRIKLKKNLFVYNDTLYIKLIKKKLRIK